MPPAVSHWEGETSAWEARLPQEGAGFAQPAWLQWATQSSQVIPESGSMMPNEPLKTLPCTPCAHGDTTFHTGPERGGAASGRSAWMLCSSKTSQIQKGSLVSEAGTLPVWQLSLSPCRRRAMCKNTVILRITIFLTDLLTFCWRLHCFNDYMVGFWVFFVSLFSIRKKDVKKLLRSSQQNHREPGERGCHPHKNEAKCTRQRGASCVLPCLRLGRRLARSETSVLLFLRKTATSTQSITLL